MVVPTIANANASFASNFLYEIELMHMLVLAWYYTDLDCYGI